MSNIYSKRQGLNITKSSLLGKILFLTIVFFFSTILNPNPALAQKSGIVITGKITDARTGENLVGATVRVPGTGIGAIANASGVYELTVPMDAEFIEASYIGYEKKVVEINGSKEINFELQPSGAQLQELVVMGYGEQQKKDLTGAVAIVSSSDIADLPVANFTQSIQGRAPGVQIVNDNAPGGQSAVRIRGFSTVRNNDPLYIIDGVPTTEGLQYINPNDVESIQVLKDASSASIYGARAANGVIVVTTKKGKNPRPELDVSVYYGIQQATNLPEMLNAQEYGDLLWQATLNDGGTPSSDIYGDGPNPIIPQFLDQNQIIPSANVDWVDEIFQPAAVQNYNLSFRQGGERSNTLFSLSYFNQEGVMKTTGFERITGRLNTDYNLVNNKLKVGQNLQVTYSNDRYVTNNSALGGLLYSAYKFPSIVPVYDLEGNFGGNPLNDIQNPLGRLEREKDNRPDNYFIFGNVFAEVNLLPNLIFKSDAGLNYTSTNVRNFFPAYNDITSIRNDSELNTSNSFNRELIWSNTLRYNQEVGKSNFNVIAGTEAIENYNEIFSASRVGFPYDEDNFRYLDAGEGDVQRNTGFSFRWALLSYFGKVDYTFDNKYLASFTLRRDGSSRLGENNWGNFPAFSLGWRLSEEKFFNINGISDLKFRVGWGQNGNQDIPAFSTISSYVSNPFYSNYDITGEQNTVGQGFTTTRVGNPDLKWETTTQTNIGLDLAILNNSVTFTADYFIKETEDLLVERPLPPLVGGTNQTIWDNVGSMENIGFELGVNYRSNPMKEFFYEIGLNFTTIQNELTALHEDIDFLAIPGSLLHTNNFGQEVTRSGVGQPIASFYGWKTDGIFRSQEEIDAHGLQPEAQPGDLKFVDINGDGVIDTEDRDFIGSPHPDFTMGLNFSANWKNFDISLFIFASIGNEIYNLTQYYGGFFNLSAYNKFADIKDAWSPDNPNSDIPRLSLDDPNNNVRPSDYYVKDGSFVRLKNLQIGYTLPNELTKYIAASRVRVYVQAQNLLTITSYDGIDPEVGLQNYNSDIRNLDIGVDRGIYPLARTITFGIDLNM